MTKNYLYKIKGDSTLYGTRYEPLFKLGERGRSFAGENPDVFVYDKWYNSTNGSELVTNGTFDTDTTGWYDGGDGSFTLSVENGSMKILRNTSSGIRLASQTISVDIGKKYVFKGNMDVTNCDIGMAYLNDDQIVTYTESGEFTYEFIANTSSVIIGFSVSNDISDYLLIDNISLFESDIEPDTAYTTPRTYLGLTGGIDEQGDIVDIDAYDIPTLNEKYIVADTIKAVKGFDLAQDMVDVSSKRAIGQIYTNTSGKPRKVGFELSADGSNRNMAFYIDGKRVYGFTINASTKGGGFIEVDSGKSYYIIANSCTINNWYESE